jgi:SNF2 family DNA or RNA helicase
MELHDYQKYAVRFIEEHPIAALFLDMGLGKTITTLTAIHNLMFDLFVVRRVLIIAPLRVARDTWSAEIEKWEHLKPLRYSVAVGIEEERIAAIKADADIYIINRENLDWLVNNTKFDYDMVVIDELSSFKNHQSKRFKALMESSTECETHRRADRNACQQRLDGFVCGISSAGYGAAARQIHRAVPECLLQAGQAERIYRVLL